MKIIKSISVFLAFVIVFGALAVPAIADDSIRVLLNNTELAFDVPPTLINGRTMVPMRKIFEELGAEVEWEDETQAIKATKDDIVIGMQINNSIMSVNDNRIILDVPPQLVNNRTLVPVRAVAESLDADVQWNNALNTVFIIKDDTRLKEEITEIIVSTADEFVRALGSNRKILLQPGVYNLSSIRQDNTSNNKNVYWEEIYDGNELVLNNINNLIIEGISSGTCEIVVEPRGIYVLKFLNSSNIRISNIKAGHTPGGDCLGGVFSFVNCSNISIFQTLMYGCGTVGLNLDSVTDMVVAESAIYECTYYIMTVENCKNIYFDYCSFIDNKEFDLVNIRNTSNLVIQESDFIGNRAYSSNPNIQYAMFSVSSSDNICVKGSIFYDNSAWAFYNSNSIVFERNFYEDNSFTYFAHPSLIYQESDNLNHDDMSAYGIRLNMTIDEVLSIKGRPLSRRVERYRNHFPFSANQTIFDYGAYFVVFDSGEVITIIINDTEYVSSKGVKIGDSVDTVMQKYGFEQINEYWNYIIYTVPFNDNEFISACIVFVLNDDNKVTEIMIQETGY